ncbi:hypothetical protein GCM10027317_33990 [Massilia agri]
MWIAEAMLHPQAALDKIELELSDACDAPERLPQQSLFCRAVHLVDANDKGTVQGCR